ncbi:hypothetical protein Q8G71_36640, partial [Klebsiella pneumoniae]
MEAIGRISFSLWTGIFLETNEGNFSSLLKVMIVFAFATATSGGCTEEITEWNHIPGQHLLSMEPGGAASEYLLPETQG